MVRTPGDDELAAIVEDVGRIQIERVAAGHDVGELRGGPRKQILRRCMAKAFGIRLHPGPYGMYEAVGTAEDARRFRRQRSARDVPLPAGRPGQVPIGQRGQPGGRRRNRRLRGSGFRSMHSGARRRRVFGFQPSNPARTFSMVNSAASASLNFARPRNARGGTGAGTRAAILGVAHGLLAGGIVPVVPALRADGVGHLGVEEDRRGPRAPGASQEGLHIRRAGDFCVVEDVAVALILRGVGGGDVAVGRNVNRAAIEVGRRAAEDEIGSALDVAAVEILTSGLGEQRVLIAQGNGSSGRCRGRP